MCRRILSRYMENVARSLVAEFGLVVMIASITFGLYAFWLFAAAKKRGEDHGPLVVATVLAVCCAAYGVIRGFLLVF